MIKTEMNHTILFSVINKEFDSVFSTDYCVGFSKVVVRTWFEPWLFSASINNKRSIASPYQQLRVTFTTFIGRKCELSDSLIVFDEMDCFFNGFFFIKKWW
jgi:hypothetical protein